MADVDLSLATGVVYQNNRDVVLGASNPLVTTDSDLGSAARPVIENPLGTPLLATIYRNNQDTVLGASNPLLTSDSELTSQNPPIFVSPLGPASNDIIYSNNQDAVLGASNAVVRSGVFDLGGTGIPVNADDDGGSHINAQTPIDSQPGDPG